MGSLMSSTINASTASGGGVITTADASGILQLQTAGVTGLTIDASQNVGIGTSSPAQKLTVSATTATQGIVSTTTGNAAYLVLQNSADSSNAYVYATGKELRLSQADTSASSIVTISTQNTERMRIDNSGNLLVGTTSAILTTARLTVATTVSAGIVSAINSNTNLFCVNTNNTSWNAISFRYNTSTEVGHIDCTSTATTYTSGSDYRLKESITPMVGGLDKIMLLNPVDFIWRINNSKGQGFIAHELQEHFPDAVSGEKDAFETYTDEDGIEQSRPKYQGVDPSKIVGALTAAIQELKAIIDTQNARIEALEAK